VVGFTIGSRGGVAEEREPIIRNYDDDDDDDNVSQYMYIYIRLVSSI
jgi:hypothetical protein